MNKTKVILALIILATTLIGYTVATQIVTRNLASQVTISAVGNIGFYNGAGSAIVTLDFGSLNSEQHRSKIVYVRNEGNTPLYLTVQRDDSVTVIMSIYKNLDDTDFQPLVPKLIGVGGEISFKIEIWSSADAVAGIYSPSFLFIGSDS